MALARVLNSLDMMESNVLQVSQEETWLELDDGLAHCFELRAAGLLLLVGFPLLRLQDEMASGLKLVVHLQEEGIHSLVSKIKMDVFGRRQAHNGIELLVFEQDILAWLDTGYVVFRPEAHLSIKIGLHILG